MSQYVDLNDGRRMPTVGLGTFQGNYDFQVYACSTLVLLVYLPGMLL